MFSHQLNDVPASTERSLQKLRARSIKTVVVTGRSMIEFSKLPVNRLPFDGYLTLNGGLLMNSEKKVYAGVSIDPNEMEVLAKIFKKKKIPSILIGEKNAASIT